MITKPEPPMNMVCRSDGGPFWWERIFCLFGYHSFQEKVNYIRGDKIYKIQEQCVCVCCWMGKVTVESHDL